jgi:tripartite-type tricarboxylate transporter receptor subunit TctC
MTKFRYLAVAAVVLAATLALNPFQAQAQQDFYAGKQLTILVNYEAGGATDLEARLIARHIGKHIPGKPNVIVQNMGGAGGLVGAKYLGEVAPRDGSMVGYFTGSTQRYVSNPERFKVDFRTYEFIAVVPSGRIHFMRTDIKPGIKAATDVVKAEDIIVGGLQRDGPKDMSMRLTLDMLGAKYRYVTGYNSSSRAMLALFRGEISYYADSPPLYRSKILPLVEKGELIPTFYDAGFDGTNFSVPTFVKGLPMVPFHELYQKIHGKMPSGPMWEAYKSILLVNGQMYRLMTLPPGVPPAAVAALRQAIQKTEKDPAYRDEAEKVMGDIPDYVSGPTLNDDVRKALSISPELMAFMAEYAKKSDK